MAPSAFDKDKADRLAIIDHLNYLESELTRHSTTPLVLQEVTDYLEEVAASKTQLIGNQRNMRHHVADGFDLSAQVTEYNTLLGKATRLHAAFHGVKMGFPATTTTATTGSSQQIKLPPLELPKFGGNLQEWVSFRDLFTTAIHNSTLTKVEKLTQLKALLTGEASRQVRNLILSEANYDIAWKALTDRYENNRELLFSILKRLMSQPTITTASASSLRSLIDTTRECVRSLDVLSCKTEHWDPILLYFIFTKLDNPSRELWEQSLPDTEIPTLDKMYDFVEQRARALAATSSSTVRIQQPQRQPQSHVRAHHAETGRCQLGCPTKHPFFHCPEFQKLTPQQRNSEVKRLNRCINCLSPGHPVSSCKSQHTCKTCKRKHHSMLHFAPDGGFQQHDHQSSSAQNHHVYTNNSIRTGLLATAVVQVHAPAGGNMRRALLDNGSTNSFITERAAKSMKLRLQPAHIPVSGLQGSSCGSVNHVTSFKISPHYDSTSIITVTALVVNTINSSIPTEKLKKDAWYHLHGLDLADPEFDVPAPVDILLGTEHFWSILENEKIHGEDGQPLAWKSTLGWLVAGPNNTSTPVSVFNTQIDLTYQLSRFFEQETIYDEDKMSKEEAECENHFATTHSRDSSGRFTVTLPLKPNTQLGHSRSQAQRRLLSLEARFTRNNSKMDDEMKRKQINHWNEYREFMDEYEKLGHMEPVPAAEIADPVNPTYYIPHHSVIKESSTTTKLRVVFDASAATSTGLSLNDCLMVGPSLQDNIADIMLRFRTHKIAFTADIAKMYRQIKINPKDADLQRILWRSSPNQPIRDYRLLTVTYGTASAPYQAVKCLQQLAVDEQQRFPEGSKVALRDYYVDDTLSGASTLEQAKEIVQQLQDLCMSGGFQLRKWTTNSQELLNVIPEDLRETSSLIEIQHHDPTIKTLGVYWNPSSDIYTFKLSMPPDMTGKHTKRSILSHIARIYDPLGWLAPVVIVCKLFMQELWKLQAGWDDELCVGVCDKWIAIRDSLADITKLEIPRCVIHSMEKRLMLVGCSDASIKAISAAIYICSYDDNDQPNCYLLTSKTRVAPVKYVTLARLELKGAVLLSELLSSVMKSLHMNFTEIRAFTDSTITLHWVTSPPTKWKPFIRRRVQAVQELIPTAKWFHIPGNINPADCASRGISATDLLHHQLWWNGTPYFFSPNQSTAELLEDEISMLEIDTKAQVHHLQPIPLHPLFLKYSTFRTLQRVIAYIMRFLNNMVRKKSYTPLQMGYLTSHELQTSSNFIIRQLQQHSFPLEMSLLHDKKPLPKGNSLIKLQPFLCSKGLLRVGGRLRNAEMPFDRKHQLLLPRSHTLTSVIIKEIHLRYLHAGPSATLAAFQQRFWVVNGRDTVRMVLKRCVVCSRHRAQLMKQVMGDLPFDRVNPSRPFSKVGVDYAGPFSIRPMVRSKVTLKCWIALFVCFSTRAVHIEVVSSLSSDAFLAAFKRFTYRRGTPYDVYSDQGTNFKGSSKILREFYQLTSHEPVQNEMTQQGINWHFNPAGAPHFGGLWEAGVKSIKHHLTRVMGSSRPTYEEFSTLLTQIEGILNSRPLVPASSDPADLDVLTPAHFLIGAPITALPEPSLLDIKENHLKRWQLLQQQQQRFWKRWSSEFITRLQQRPKWWYPSPELSIGHLVLIKDERMPPLKWKLGRVTAVHPGKDGHVRVATMKTADGEVKRPIVKLSLLPIAV